MSVNILAIGAHPDDIEFGCGALLLLERQAGTEVKLLVLSRGEAASSGAPEVRERESRAAAAQLGAEIDFLDFHGDCYLEYNPQNAIRLAGEIRRAQPAIVLAPHPEANQHPDHAAAGRLVRDACRLARYGGLMDLLTLPPHRVGQLYFYDITRHGVRPPDVVVDVSPVAGAWQQLMAIHATQAQTKPYVELQLAAARLLGFAIGVEYACGVYANDPVRVEHLSSITLSSRNF